MQPKSIKMFQILAWISIGLTAFFTLILGVAGGIAAGALGFGGQFFLVMLFPLALIVAMAVLVHMAAKKRSGVARWLYVALAAILVLLSLGGLAAGRDSNAFGIIIVLLQCGLLVGSIVFLLMPDSAAYFSGQQGAYGGGYPPQHGGYPPAQQGNWGGSQGGYPPQQGGGYPPQQGGYPPQVGTQHGQGGGFGQQQPSQGGGYPPQQGNYPPQQGGYPPQHGGYPPQQGGGYPPQQGGGYPPQQGGGYPPPPPGGSGY